MIILKKLYKKVIWLAILLIVIVLVFFFIKKASVFSSRIKHTETIELSPAEIQAIREIGEWEFLSLPTEELVDTIRKGFFMDDRLVRIYYGTLRLGIDLKQTSADWIKTQGDTVIVKLPPIILLEKNFINEAETKAFYESGVWSESAKQTLYYKAYNSMKRRCMTEENKKIAETNAIVQVSALFRSFGFKEIIVSFPK